MLLAAGSREKKGRTVAWHVGRRGERGPDAKQKGNHENRGGLRKRSGRALGRRECRARWPWKGGLGKSSS